MDKWDYGQAKFTGKVGKAVNVSTRFASLMGLVVEYRGMWIEGGKSRSAVPEVPAIVVVVVVVVVLAIGLRVSEFQQLQ